MARPGGALPTPSLVAWNQTNIREVHFFTERAVWLGDCNKNRGGSEMLHYAWVFLVLALIAAIFGFGGIAVAAAGIAKVLFFIFIVLFLIGLLTGRRPV